MSKVVESFVSDWCEMGELEEETGFHPLYRAIADIDERLEKLQRFAVSSNEVLRKISVRRLQFFKVVRARLVMHVVEKLLPHMYEGPKLAPMIARLRATEEALAADALCVGYAPRFWVDTHDDDDPSGDDDTFDDGAVCYGPYQDLFVEDPELASEDIADYEILEMHNYCTNSF
jgi:hypothetical protein